MNVVKLPTANDRFDAKAADCAVEIGTVLHAMALKYGKGAMLAGLYTNMVRTLRQLPPVTRAVCLSKLARDGVR